MRFGVFGGTFDPPHEGHVALARAARDALHLDEVVFVPARRNPNKRRRTFATAKQRLEMVRLAIAGEPGMSASDVEISRPGPSYAVETIAELAISRPGDYWFLLGGDALAGLEEWYLPEKLLRLCRLAAIARGSDAGEKLLRLLPDWARNRVDVVAATPHPASSTEIRDAIGRGRAPRWLHPDVVNYIGRERLYRSEGDNGGE